MSLQYTLLVTGPAYGTQQAIGALSFAKALLAKKHRLSSVFFYREGVTNANRLTLPATDEYDTVREWIKLSQKHNFPLQICITAALRRGIIDQQSAEHNHLESDNWQAGFTVSGLGALAESIGNSDRVIQF